jgi:hypothetical protein
VTTYRALQRICGRAGLDRTLSMVTQEIVDEASLGNTHHMIRGRMPNFGRVGYKSVQRYGRVLMDKQPVFSRVETGCCRKVVATRYRGITDVDGFGVKTAPTDRGTRTMPELGNLVYSSD